MVSGPMRPMNIIAIESSLLLVDSPPVIPVDSPTVPNALTTSNSASETVSR